MANEPGYQGLFCTSDVACAEGNTCIQDAHGQEDLGFCIPTYSLDCMSESNFGLNALDKGKVAQDIQACATEKHALLSKSKQDKLDDFIGGCCVGTLTASLAATVAVVGASAEVIAAVGSGGDCLLGNLCFVVPGSDAGLAASLDALIGVNFVDTPADSTGDSIGIGFEVHIYGVGVSIGIDVSCELTTLLGFAVGGGLGLGVEIPWDIATCECSELTCGSDTSSSFLGMKGAMHSTA